MQVDETSIGERVEIVMLSSGLSGDYEIGPTTYDLSRRRHWFLGSFLSCNLDTEVGFRLW